MCLSGYSPGNLLVGKCEEEMGAAIEVQNLTRRFGKFTAVDHISFQVEKGKIFGFLGANGAGKSTTIRMLCGLLAPTDGTAMVGGYNIVTETEDVKHSIGYMSQRFSLYEDLTVEENIKFFGGVYGLAESRLRQRMDWIVDMAGLQGRQKSLTKTLSGGWKQRLALGCAILHEPQIVFLDEPTSGVDPISRRKFWDLINQLSESGVTLLVTTHYLDEAEYCNDILLINGGRLIATGSPKQLKERHITYTIFEAEATDIVNALELLRKEPWVIEISLFGTYLHIGVKDGVEAPAKISSVLMKHGITIRRIEKITPSLEDVFLHLLTQDNIRNVA
jgi:drug efflux transport system ATP-binding protein